MTLKNTPKRKRNSKPEAIVQNQILFELFRLGCFAWVIDSKARYSEQLKRYKKSEIPIGHPDIIGVDSKGRFIAVECKAPGKIENTTIFQRDFLKRLKDKGAFAIVADSPQTVRQLYLDWDRLK